MLHNNELISIEEILVKPQNNNHEQPMRQFILFNRQTNLKICIYTFGAKIMSCMLDQQEIVVCNNGGVAENDNDNIIINDNPMLVNWNSHVYGSDTIRLLFNVMEYQLQSSAGSSCQRLLSSVCGTHSLTYCLTKNDEFIIEGNNFQLTDLLFNPIFFNLNSVTNNPCLDGHKMHIRTSNESVTALVDHDPSNGTNVMQTMIGHKFIGQTGPAPLSNCMEDCELIYSIATNNNNVSIPGNDIHMIAKLTYKNRYIETWLQIESGTKTALKILIKNGAIAFVPYGMNKFRLRYRFHW